jgi:hypothetical protein
MPTPRLSLPLLAAGQAQKHVTLNESLIMLDDVVQLSVEDASLANPPSDPVDGARYIVASPSGGAWSGWDGWLACRDGGSWRFHAAGTGWQAWDKATGRMLVRTAGGGWTESGLASPQAVQRVGRLAVNASPDPAHRLTLGGASSRFAHEGADHRLYVDKASTGHTASIVLQSAGVGRAEIGLAGSDDLSLKVSPDGANWTEALSVATATGRVAFAQGAPAAAGGLLINGDFLVNQRAFPGGALAAGVYGPDRWRAGPGGCGLSFLAGGGVELSGALEQMIEVPFSSRPHGLAHLGGAALTLSVESALAGAPLAHPIAVQIGAQTAQIAAGPGRRSVTVQLGAAETGDILVRLTPTAQTAIRRIRLDVGGRAQGFTPRDHASELLACQRYACTAYLAVLSPVVGQVLCPVAFPARMRATPSVSVMQPGVANGATVTTDHARGPVGTYSTFNITMANGYWVDRVLLYSAEL